MLKLSIPVVVEGKYDKARLSQVVDAAIVTTDGFGVFNNQEKTALLRQLGGRGIIVLCDSDGGGTVIRSHLKSALSGTLKGARIYDLYIPQIPGKERRKKKAGKAGFLGVEGIDNQTLEALFLRLAEAHPEILADTGAADGGIPAKEITKTDLFCLGLTGGEGSSDRRDALCAHIGFPKGMTPNALLSALQMLYTPETLAELCESLFGDT